MQEETKVGGQQNVKYKIRNYRINIYWAEKIMISFQKKILKLF